MENFSRTILPLQGNTCISSKKKNFLLDIAVNNPQILFIVVNFRFIGAAFLNGQELLENATSRFPEDLAMFKETIEIWFYGKIMWSETPIDGHISDLANFFV